jgi:hypothetical protein
VCQVIWGPKRKDYRSILKGFAQAIECIMSGVEGRSKWVDICAVAFAAIVQVAQIHSSGVLERMKG